MSDSPRDLFLEVSTFPTFYERYGPPTQAAIDEDGRALPCHRWRLFNRALKAMGARGENTGHLKTKRKAFPVSPLPQALLVDSTNDPSG